MPNLSFQFRPGVKTKITPQLWGRVKLSNFMELPEDEFRQLVKKVETHPLFQRLVLPDHPRKKIISRQRFPQSDFNRRFYQIKEGLTPGTRPPDLSPLLEKQQALLPRIQKIGEDNFKRFFLYPEDGLKVDEIARVCQISPAEVRAIQGLMDEFSVLDLTHPARVPATSPAAPAGTKIARIARPENKEGGSEFQIEYFSSHYARGRYVVNYKKLFELKAQGEFSGGDTRKIERLIKEIELINARQTILHQVIKQVLDVQTVYFTTGQEDDLQPLTQQMLARHLKVHRSTVNRAINHKYLEAPWGEEKYLKFFLINQKKFVKRRIFKIVQQADKKISHQQIKNLIHKNYGINLARRTICAYSQELNSHLSKSS